MKRTESLARRWGWPDGVGQPKRRGMVLPLVIVANLLLAGGSFAGQGGAAKSADDLLKNPKEAKAEDLLHVPLPVLEAGRAPDMSRWMVNRPAMVTGGKDASGVFASPVVPLDADGAWRPYDTNASPLGKEETMDDLARDFGARAFDGLTKSLIEEAPADPNVRRSGKEGEANQLALSFTNLREIVGGLSKIDSVNGLGEPIGVFNRAVTEIDVVPGKDSSIVINGLGEPIGNVGESHSNASSMTAYDGGVPSSGNRETPLPPWLTEILDVVGELTHFAHENMISVLVVCVVTMGVSTLIQRKH